MYPRIRNLREDKDITQSQMAEMLHITQSAYSKYELGRRDIPTMALIKIAKFHDVSVDYLLGRSDTPKLPK